jgi:putative NIF3 family GTP cyclohydrolase 1 type 2
MTMRRKQLVLLLIIISAFFQYGCGASRNSLTSAIIKGDRMAATKAIDRGVSTQAPDGLRDTPLDLAVRTSDPELIELLLQRGAAANLDGRLLTDHLCAAIEGNQGNSHAALKIVMSLVTHGADTRPAACRMTMRFPGETETRTINVTPLALATARVDTDPTQGLVRYLVEQPIGTVSDGAGVSVSKPMASLFGSMKIQGASSNLMGLFNELSTTRGPSHTVIAAQKGLWDMVDLFLAKGGEVSDAAYGAILAGNVARVQSYLDRGALPSVEMMRAAVTTKSKGLIQLLIEHGYVTGSSTVRTDKSGRMHSLVMEAVDSGDVEILKTILLTGAEPNEGGNSNPLCRAVSKALGKSKQYEMVGVDSALELTNMLVAAGANPNLACQGYWGTPLRTAANSEGLYELTKALLAAGADPNMANDKGDTPLHGYEERPKTAYLLIAMGANVKAKAEDGDTPLHDAAWGDAAQTAGVLLQAGAEVNALDGSKYSPLDQTIDSDGSINKPAAHRVISSYGGRAIWEEGKKRRQAKSDNFGKFVATFAVAGLAGSANLSADQTAQIMSATVNDVWIENGKGRQLGDMYKESVAQGGTASSGNPLVDEMVRTRQGQQSASAMMQAEMASYQEIIARQRQKNEQRPTVYQQELQRIAAQTGSGSVAVAQPLQSGAVQGAAARHHAAPAYAAQAGGGGAPAATSQRPAVSANSLAASSPAVARPVTTGGSKREQVSCEGRTESGNPLPSGECGIIYADYSRTLHFEYDDYHDTFMSEGGSRASAENSLRVAMRKKAEEMCRQEGYSYLYHPANYRLREIEATVKECKDYKRAGTTFYLCRGSSEFTCARREEK